MAPQSRKLSKILLFQVPTLDWSRHDMTRLPPAILKERINCRYVEDGPGNVRETPTYYFYTNSPKWKTSWVVVRADLQSRDQRLPQGGSHPPRTLPRIVASKVGNSDATPRTC